MPVYQLKNIADHINTGVWKITESSKELADQLIKKGYPLTNMPDSKNENRLKQWLATRLLLNEFFNNVTIAYNEFGKPFLSNDKHISISHSNDLVAIIINENSPCGIDIEKISDKVERIKHKFLNPLDIENVTSIEELTLYWGAKEALYKYYGQKKVLFIEHLFIDNYSKKSTSFAGKIDMTDFKIELPMMYENIDDYILVHTL